MAEVVGEVLDVSGKRLVDAQAVEGQQRDQRSGTEPVGMGRLQELDDFLLDEPNRGGVVGDLRPLHSDDGGGLDQRGIDDGVPVEPPTGMTAAGR